MVLSILDILCKCKHTIYGILCLVSFTKNDLLNYNAMAFVRSSFFLAKKLAFEAHSFADLGLVGSVFSADSCFFM